MKITVGSHAIEPERMEGTKQSHGVSPSAQCHYYAFARGKKSTGENYVSHFFLKRMAKSDVSRHYERT